MTYLKKATLTAACALTLSMGLTIAPDKAQAGVDPFIGDIMIVGFNFCPRGWAAADGQLIAISNNQALYALLGTMYGGDGRSTFALPDLRGRAAIGQGSGPGLTSRLSGQKGGSVSKSMTVTTMASHSHAVNATNLDGDMIATTHLIQHSIPLSISLVHSYCVILVGAWPKSERLPNYACFPPLESSVTHGPLPALACRWACCGAAH